MIVCIVGSRTFNDYDLFKKLIFEYALDNENNFINFKKIISGGCYGTDKLAERFANEYNIVIEVYNAEWNKFGKSAGPIRNKIMIEKSDFIIAFIKDDSKGTRNSIRLAESLDKEILVFDLN